MFCGHRPFPNCEFDFQTASSEMKLSCQEFYQDTKNFFNNMFDTNLHHSGMVQSVYPISNEIPVAFVGKCYHYIKFADKSRFKLIFATTNFEDLKDKIAPGKMIEIIYSQPDYQIVNIFPMEKRSNRVATLETIIDDLEDDDIDIGSTMAKAYYVDDQLQRIDLIKL